MTMESLMKAGLTEDQARGIMEELESDYVTRADLDNANAELETARADVEDRDGQIETLRQDHKSELNALKIGHAVEMALIRANAKNTTATKALLADFIATAELDENGTVKGLSDAVKKLVDGKDTAFLFDKATERKFRGVKPTEKGDGDGGTMSIESFRKLSPTERYDFSIKHPDEYKEMYGGNM